MSGLGRRKIIFVVEQDPGGGCTARAVGYSIYTEGSTMAELRANIRDVLRCHFGTVQGIRPVIVRREEK